MCSRVLNIDELVREGMFYPVYHDLVASPGGETAIPPDQRERARQIYYEHISKGAETVRAFECILMALDGLGMPILVIKGPAIDFLIYDGFARPRLDLDIVVKEADIPAMEKALGGLGYAPRLDDIDYPVPEHLESRVFTAGSADMMAVHLHCSPFNNMYLSVDGFFRPDMARVWQKTEPFQSYRNIVVLKPAMNIVYLCDHALKHGCDQRVLFYEIEELMRRYAGRVAWEEVFTLARDVGLEQIVRQAATGKKLSRDVVFRRYLSLRKGWLAKVRFVWLTVFPPGFDFAGYVRRLRRLVLP